MSHLSLEIRRAVVQESALLSDAARRIFSETFGADNTPEAMADYLNGAFTPDIQAAEIAGESRDTFLAWIANRIVGYAQLKRGEPDPGVQGIRPIELNRLYVEGAWQGRGVAQALMETCKETARQQGFKTLWLAVDGESTRAQAFYRKCGFRVIGSKTFWVGNIAHNDLVMEASL